MLAASCACSSSHHGENEREGHFLTSS